MLQRGISNVKVSSEDGFIYCKFVVPLNMSLTHISLKEEVHHHHHDHDGGNHDDHDDGAVHKNITELVESEEKFLSLDRDVYLFIAVGDVYNGEITWLR